VQGPRSREILKDIVWAPPQQPQLDELKWFRFLVGRIGDYDGIPIMVSRTGYSGELGYEFDDQVDPFEAGIGFAVKLDSEEDFLGKDALLERSAHPQRTLVGLELAGNEPAQHGDCVHVGRSQVGVITSGTKSPTLRKNIALCRMAVQYAEPGTEVEVGKLDGHQKRIPAQVVPIPFYDPRKERPRS
jgi:aminomethyltransferase